MRQPNDTLAVSLADTLPQEAVAAPGVDSLRRACDTLPEADSLRMAVPCDTVPKVDTVSAAVVFGAGSERTVVSLPAEAYGRTASPLAGVGYQLTVVGLLLLFVYMAFRLRAEWRRLLTLAWRREEDTHDDEADVPPFGVQVALIGCGVWMLGVAATRFGLLVPGAAVRFAHGSAGAVVATFAVLVLAVIAVQRLLIGAIASLTFSRGWERALGLQRLAWFASLVLSATPLVVLAALCGARWGGVFAVCFALVAGVHALGYVIRSCLLFARLKVSILLWILYLCAVEIVPVGSLAVGLLRSWPA